MPRCSCFRFIPINSPRDCADGVSDPCIESIREIRADLARLRLFKKHCRQRNPVQLPLKESLASQI